MKNKLLACFAAFALAGTTQEASAVNVALELVLLVDVSGSIDSNEYNLQRSGYVNAFQSPTIQNLISTLNTQGGGLAVTYIEWSGAGQQSIEVPWTHLTDAASSNAFAAAISSASRNFSGLTAPGSALNFATPLFTSNDFDAPRQVIDVSGDGEQNDGSNTATARNAALAAGVDRINGLAIVTPDFPNLQTWYANNIQGGANSFTIAANFNNFDDAIEAKLRAEITDTTPTPDGGTTLALLGLSLMGIYGAKKRRK